ncbi:GATA-4/5/6 transcription factors [Phaffia rhodozyma]|uniref:GATA-4/5/6 transcription factors n=1 Tax=Phaffia rhodozyma TaxID=264483 RepID=A0A0F7SGI8_PHARH|nr:GATA-4/5/6 transcription factors [Phaffia rhodozyma]
MDQSDQSYNVQAGSANSLQQQQFTLQQQEQHHQPQLQPSSTTIGNPSVARPPNGQNGQTAVSSHPTSFGSTSTSSTDNAIFEFTKRKRWPNLLVNEMTDTTILVVMPLSNGSAKILFASPSVKDLLGYNASEILDRSLTDFVYDEDQAALLNYLHQSILTRTDLASYHRFLVKRPPPPVHLSSTGSNSSAESSSSTESSSDSLSLGFAQDTPDSADGTNSRSRMSRRRKTKKTVLLEVRGHGYWGEEEEREPLPLSITQTLPPGQAASNTSSTGTDGRCMCFFLMIKKWLSKNGEMLNSFLEEKMINERLRAEVLELSGQQASPNPNILLQFSAPPVPDSDNSSYGRTSFPGQAAVAAAAAFHRQPQLNHTTSYSSIYDDSGIGGGAYDDNDSDVERPGGSALGRNLFMAPVGDSARSTVSSGPGSIKNAAGLGLSISGLPTSALSSGPGPSGLSQQQQQQPQEQYGSHNKSQAVSQSQSNLSSMHPLQTSTQPTSSQHPSVQQQQQQQQPSMAQQDSLKKPKKVKKSKEEHNYVCVTCGRTDSPEWRKGPLGPKTLCNACGLRYAKKQQASGTAPAPAPKKKSISGQGAIGPTDTAAVGAGIGTGSAEGTGSGEGLNV